MLTNYLANNWYHCILYFQDYLKILASYQLWDIDLSIRASLEDNEKQAQDVLLSSYRMCQQISGNFFGSGN